MDKMDKMTYTDKAIALQSLIGWYNFSLRVREDRTWYVSMHGVYRREGGGMGSHTSSAATPQEAIDAAWAWAAHPDAVLVLTEGNEYQYFKWNGFMWAKTEKP